MGGIRGESGRRLLSHPTGKSSRQNLAEACSFSVMKPGKRSFHLCDGSSETVKKMSRPKPSLTQADVLKLSSPRQRWGAQ